MRLKSADRPDQARGLLAPGEFIRLPPRCLAAGVIADPHRVTSCGPGSPSLPKSAPGTPWR
ncbi:MAG: hypothetical protein MZV70_60990 [Desulfobacterales bacterium]|nr:hypothetical protein [Desulfobacterales bacterium]